MLERKNMKENTFTLMFNFALGKTKTFVFLQNKGKNLNAKKKVRKLFSAMSCIDT